MRAPRSACIRRTAWRTGRQRAAPPGSACRSAPHVPYVPSSIRPSAASISRTSCSAFSSSESSTSRSRMSLAWSARWSPAAFESSPSSSSPSTRSCAAPSTRARIVRSSDAALFQIDAHRSSASADTSRRSASSSGICPQLDDLVSRRVRLRRRAARRAARRGCPRATRRPRRWRGHAPGQRAHGPSKHRRAFRRPRSVARPASRVRGAGRGSSGSCRRRSRPEG